MPRVSHVDTDATHAPPYRRCMSVISPWIRRTALVLCGVLVIAWFVAGRAGRSSSQPEGGATVISTGETNNGREIVVYVAGAVRRPGVYRLRPSERVIHAIQRAGGAARNANMVAVNLAAPLQDGQQIVLPRRTSRSDGSGDAPAGTISLAAATVDQLDELDGIGPTLAARIVEWRDRNGGFRSVDDLTQVPGIGEVRLEAIRSSLTP